MLSVQLYTWTQPSSVPSHIVDWVRSISSPPSDLASEVVDDTLCIVVDDGTGRAGDCSFTLSLCISRWAVRAFEFSWALNSMSDSLSLELLESNCRPLSLPSVVAGVAQSSPSFPGTCSTLPLVPVESRDALVLNTGRRSIN